MCFLESLYSAAKGPTGEKQMPLKLSPPITSKPLGTTGQERLTGYNEPTGLTEFLKTMFFSPNWVETASEWRKVSELSD